MYSMDGITSPEPPERLLGGLDSSLTVRWPESETEYFGVGVGPAPGTGEFTRRDRK